MIESAYGFDVYGGFKKFLRSIDDLRSYYFAYDWRKSPGYQGTQRALDNFVDKTLEASGRDKVVLVAHSMGGLVARAYINSHSEKVARVLTIATPYWGAAMPWLALAHGLTGPPTDSWWPDLDTFIPNDELQLFAINAAGAYNLYPSPAYYEQIGGWLSFSGTSGGITYLTQDQTLSAVRQFLGNKSLYKQALDYHTSYLDTYYSNPNVPWQMIVGTGVKTLTGIVYQEDSAKPTYIYGNGDGTVPILSSAEGVEDTSIVHYVCRIEHSALPEQKGVQAMIKDYIYTGGPIVNPQGGFCEPPE